MRMSLTANVPSLVVGLDPTPWAGTIVNDLVTTEGRDAPHATLSSAAELPRLLTELDPLPPGTYCTIVVNVEEFDLTDLEDIRSAVDSSCLVIALHRRALDPARSEWASRAGGIALRAGPTTRVDIEALSRLAYGRALQTPAVSPPDNLLVFLSHSSGDKEQVRSCPYGPTRRPIRRQIGRRALPEGCCRRRPTTFRRPDPPNANAVTRSVPKPPPHLERRPARADQTARWRPVGHRPSRSRRPQQSHQKAEPSLPHM